MIFDDVFAVADVGTSLKVSSGDPEPEVNLPGGDLLLAAWKSLNFTGRVVEKNEDGRYLALQDTTSMPGSELIRVMRSDSPVVFEILAPNTALAEKVAFQRLERAAQEVSLKTFDNFRRQIAVMILWTEVQRLKAGAAAFSSLSGLEQARQYPTLWALSQVYSSTIPAVATAAEARLQPAVQEMVMYEAKLMFAEDQIKAATTVEAKLAAAEIQWKS
jgi:hypothetical protein